MTLENKVIIVTGASRGIGKEIAIQLAKNGAKVVVNYSNSSKEAKETVDTITKNNGSAIAIKADVSRKIDVTELFDKTISTYGKVDVLVNNAGVMISKQLKDNTEDDFSKQFDINVKGIFNTLQEAYHKLSDNGNIINISSSTVKLMFPTYALYSASKAAVEQMTRVFSKEIGRGISVNALAPGATETELFMKGKSQEFIDKLSNMNAFNRLAQPLDIAKVVLFLASDDSKWISGQVIGANGALV
ncbi:SDR family oxidoreductase [Winogradskyella psychrotolerans]|uniref:SDR family oxidoreductase n=1 Tax=Winogradskyella damuponensis TaxID=943939 RepID=A0ABP8CSG7_9FLAO|nr:SDR family oxidoreductase [Winogradskyella psychrotolerans]MBU2920745.1 SDR family oxidoreductase [Winogradskyella psychrotolerans]|eukprot:TRINITY_DN1194_c0_g1_i1.p2 TRINITY_DN1194_c0_g1~~TRINITY_DN1194_c0_g1_i1.p2  ORF type:complete len:245 (+),score=61.85 TRINITY_DN1194_c0_g1_i1:1511-2245(+)